MSWIGAIPAIPLAGFLALAVIGRRIPAWATAVIGAGSVGLAFVAAAAAAVLFWTSPPAGAAVTVVLWQW